MSRDKLRVLRCRLSHTGLWSMGSLFQVKVMREEFLAGCPVPLPGHRSSRPCLASVLNSQPESPSGWPWDWETEQKAFQEWAEDDGAISSCPVPSSQWVVREQQKNVQEHGGTEGPEQVAEGVTEAAVNGRGDGCQLVPEGCLKGREEASSVTVLSTPD